jgi:hypothetical protein
MGYPVFTDSLGNITEEWRNTVREFNRRVFINKEQGGSTPGTIVYNKETTSWEAQDSNSPIGRIETL